MTINISDWYSKMDHRYWLRKPFSYKGKTIASNGHIMLIAPAAYYRKIDDQKFIAVLCEVLELLENLDFKPLTGLTLPEPAHCTTCNGTGKTKMNICEECGGDGDLTFRSDCNNYTVDCITCDGSGKTIGVGEDNDCAKCKGSGACYKEFEAAHFNGFSYQAKYLKLIANEPNLLYAYPPTTHKFHSNLFFKTGDYSGVISTINILNWIKNAKL